MKISDITPDIVGKKVSFIFTGLESTGVVTDLYESAHVKGVCVKFDKPIQWADEQYTERIFSARKCDGFSFGLDSVELNEPDMSVECDCHPSGYMP